LTEDLTLIGL